MTRVVHTADTHLGYQQYHVPERREDFLEAFRTVVADAVDGDVDAVVHAGDLFHDRRPTLPDILGALDVLRTLAEADVPFLAVVGNHETKRDAQWLDLFSSLGLATRLGAEPVTIGTTAFYGLDFVPRARRDDLSLGFDPHDADHAVLVTHGLFEPFDLGEWDVRDLLRESDVAFDAVLLGDNHDPGTKRVEEPYEAWVTYCGSTERASADERAERGYNLVSFDADGVDVRRRGIETRKFVYVDVPLGSGEGGERVREQVGQYDLEDAVVIVSVDGDGEPVTPAAIEEYALDRGALVARVTDRREFADAEEVAVTFADPDDAVHDRLRDLGLSEAARELDETVRAGDVADSNVDDAVEDRVRDLVEAADPSVFAPAELDGDEDETVEEARYTESAEIGDEAATPTDAEGTDRDEVRRPASEGDRPETSETSRPPAETGDASAESTDGTPEGEQADGEPTGGETEESEPPGGETEGSEPTGSATEDQATMEEYL